MHAANIRGLTRLHRRAWLVCGRGTGLEAVDSNETFGHAQDRGVHRCAVRRVSR